MGEVTKRDLLKGVGAAFTSTALGGPLSLLVPRQAKADPVLIAMVAIAVLQLALSYANRSKGMGNIVQAFDLKLDRILQGQIETLKSVSLLSQQMDNLTASIPDMLIVPEFRKTYKDCFDASSKAKDLTESLMRLNWYEYSSESYRQMYDLYDRADSVANSFIIDSKSEVSGLSGINCLLTANNTAILLSQLVESLTAIDSNIPWIYKPSSWDASFNFSRLNEKIIKAINENLIEGFSSRLLTEQLQKQNVSKEVLTQNGIGKWILPAYGEGQGQPPQFEKSLTLYASGPDQTSLQPVGNTVLPQYYKMIYKWTQGVAINYSMTKVSDPDVYIYKPKDIAVGPKGYMVEPTMWKLNRHGDFKYPYVNVTPEQLANTGLPLPFTEPEYIKAVFSDVENKLQEYNAAICFAESVRASRIGFQDPVKKLSALNPKKPSIPAINPQPTP